MHVFMQPGGVCLQLNLFWRRSALTDSFSFVNLICVVTLCPLCLAGHYVAYNHHQSLVAVGGELPATN